MIVEKVTGDSGPCVTSFMECKLELFQKACVTSCRTAPLRKRYPIVENSYLQSLTIEIQLEIDFLGTILPIECIRTNCTLLHFIWWVIYFINHIMVKDNLWINLVNMFCILFLKNDLFYKRKINFRFVLCSYFMQSM